jgi:hypothetical protein
LRIIKERYGLAVSLMFGRNLLLYYRKIQVLFPDFFLLLTAKRIDSPGPVERFYSIKIF